MGYGGKNKVPRNGSECPNAGGKRNRGTVVGGGLSYFLASRQHEKPMEKFRKIVRETKKPLGGVKNAHSIKLPDNLKRSGWVHEMLSNSPKTPTRDNLNETHFWLRSTFFLIFEEPKIIG